VYKAPFYTQRSTLGAYYHIPRFTSYHISFWYSISSIILFCTTSSIW